jgi:sec-independent protein translocase protein TatC
MAANPQVAPGQPAESPDEFKMSLAEHLTELRSRLIRVTISVVVLGGVSLAFAKEIYGFLMQPVLRNLPPEASALVYTSAIEEINVYMKVGLYAGIFFTTPVILWQIWGFVAPGLYPKERRFIWPFIIFGTVSFIGGAVFCYSLLLPQMFGFLLREEGSVALEQRLVTGRLRSEDAVRFLRLGELARAGELAKQANQELEASGEGQAKAEGDFGVRLNPKQSVEAMKDLEGLGKLADAVRDGLGDPSRPVLNDVLQKREAGVEAFGKRDYGETIKQCDEGAAMFARLDNEHAEDFSQLWRVFKNLSTGQANYEATNWTRPMLSMTEQLTLVLVLELAFGVIFELPLVMMVLGMVGLVSSKFLFKYQRHAFVVCLIAAAIITPTGDAVNLSLMAGPMLLCYELGVLLVWLVEKRRAKETAIAPVPK